MREIIFECNVEAETHFYRAPDMGGGVGGINYACQDDGTGLNYKHYSLRGDVIVTTDGAGGVLSQSQYDAYGRHNDYGVMPTDKHRANTKVEDSENNLLLEGQRYRHLEHMMFMSPDPLEYVDGLNFYAYCGFNPWGRWDPLGLEMTNEYNDLPFYLQGENECTIAAGGNTFIAKTKNKNPPSYDNVKRRHPKDKNRKMEKLQLKPQER